MQLTPTTLWPPSSSSYFVSSIPVAIGSQLEVVLDRIFVPKPGHSVPQLEYAYEAAQLDVDDPGAWLRSCPEARWLTLTLTLTLTLILIVTLTLTLILTLTLTLTLNSNPTP